MSRGISYEMGWPLKSLRYHGLPDGSHFLTRCSEFVSASLIGWIGCYANRSTNCRESFRHIGFYIWSLNVAGRARTAYSQNLILLFYPPVLAQAAWF